jgi:dihydrolipoamide dehydrogenase
MPPPESCDLLVIGAGPGGYPAAFRAAELGLSVTLVDPEADPGGVCLYRGCVPSKALLHVADFLHQVEQAPVWGVTLGKPAIDVNRLREWKQEVVIQMTRGLGQIVRARKIRYVRGLAKLLDPHTARITPNEGAPFDQPFGQAIVATGSQPALIPGAPASPNIMSSSEALDPTDVPPRLLVIGGGYIGIELGQVYASLGSRVTLVEMMPAILPEADRELVRHLEKRLRAQMEAVLTGTKVKSMAVTPEGIRVELEGASAGDGLFDKVLVAVGRKPLTREVGLEKTAARITPGGFVEVDGQRRTAEPSIFAVGDITGEPMLAHKATHEGRVAAEAAAGKKTVFEPAAIPFVVFSDPEIAWCGLTRTRAEREGRKVKVTSFPWSASGRAATLSRPDGMTQLLSDPASGRILGIGLAGHGAGELLAEGVLAMEMGAVADDLALTIHTHPTLSETLMEAAEAFSGSSTHYLGMRKG